MTIEELKEAFAAGAQIQIRIDWIYRSSEWRDINNPVFDCPEDYYRIKPKVDNDN